MKVLYKNLIIITAIFFIGCASTGTIDPITDIDRLQKTVTLTSAVDLADRIIHNDPNKWGQVFDILLEKAVANPHPENRNLIRNLFKEQVKNGILEKRNVFARINRYLSTEFTTVIERKDRSYTVCRDLPRFKIELREELADKKTGLLMASNSQSLYETAEINSSRYTRTFEGLCTAVSYKDD